MCSFNVIDTFMFIRNMLLIRVCLYYRFNVIDTFRCCFYMFVYVTLYVYRGARTAGLYNFKHRLCSFNVIEYHPRIVPRLRLYEVICQRVV